MTVVLISNELLVVGPVNMSSIITGIFECTFGLLFNKTRDWLADHLNEGDVVQEKLRDAIIRETYSISCAQNTVAEKEYKVCINYLREGLLRVTGALPNSRRKIHSQILHSRWDEPLDICNNLHQALALPNDAAAMDINTLSRVWEPAKASFEKAHKNATGVFYNGILDIEKRIMACKIRMVASMVLHIDNLDLAVNDCLLYLSQLHELRSVRREFEVNETRGVSSKFYKDKRFKVVDEVNRINQCLFYFIKEYMDYKRIFQNITKWPTIQVKSREHVFYGAERLLQKPGRGLGRPRFESSIYQPQSYEERFREVSQPFDEECDGQFQLPAPFYKKPLLSDSLQFINPLPCEEQFSQQSQSSYKERDAQSQSPTGFAGRFRAGLTKMFVKDECSDPRTEKRRSHDQFQSFERRRINACQQPQLSDKRFYEDPQLSAKDNFNPIPGRRRFQLQSSERRSYQEPQLSDEEYDDQSQSFDRFYEDPELPTTDNFDPMPGRRGFQLLHSSERRSYQEPQLSDEEYDDQPQSFDRFYEDPELPTTDNFDPMPGRRRFQLQSFERRFCPNPQLSDEEFDEEDPQLPVKDYDINQFMSSTKQRHSFDQSQYLQNSNDYEEYDEFDRTTKTLVRVRRLKR